ncbi:transmembrane protease serine 3 [Anarrhichthys ocellatus]|uniref:transmembrane protease serine 3 n=1 Tax=Anarrhichthys ocellatus TaxID=433405 RepID=UPI0012ECDADA|nr:transmembrane protease serine 3 [Anarrhichthys ocellatus]
MTKSFVEINPAANTALPNTSTPTTELKTETPQQPDPSRIEVVSVTEEDLPTVETPKTLNVSPLGSFAQSENHSTKPEEPRPPAAPSPTMPITKVQPFINEDDLEKSWRSRLLAHRLELLMASCLIVVFTLALGIGLGVGLSCVGKFRCGSSSKCIRPSAQCDGEVDCDNGEDELGCVRLSGRSSVLQVQRGGAWRTVCSEGWNNWLGISACKQLGYSRYVESFFVSLTSIEQDLQYNLVSISLSQSQIIKLQNATTFRFADPSMWVVHAGLTEQPVHGAQSLAVEQIIYHTRYRPKGLDYDIALMKLAMSLAFNGLVEPICLPNYGEDFEEGTMCWISGWGATKDEGETSVVLRSAVVPLLSTKTCNQPEVYHGSISSWMICAGHLEGGTDSCQGDSGGPLACEDSSVWKLVGATSWGSGCAMRNKPGVYTRITRSLSWIRQQMEREEARGSPTLSTDN